MLKGNTLRGCALFTLVVCAGGSEAAESSVMSTGLAPGSDTTPVALPGSFKAPQNSAVIAPPAVGATPESPAPMMEVPAAPVDAVPVATPAVPVATPAVPVDVPAVPVDVPAVADPTGPGAAGEEPACLSTLIAPKS